MANRQFREGFHTFEKQAVALFGVFTMTGTGPNTFTSDAKGFSLAVSDTGEWTITLEDKYHTLLNAVITVEAAATSDITTQIESEAVASTKTIVFSTLAAAVQTGLASGDVLRVTLFLRNSTAP